MLVYLVCEEMFSPFKEDTLVYDRFVSLLRERNVDTVLIAGNSKYRHEIDTFTTTYGNLVNRVVAGDASVDLAGHDFQLRASSLITPRNEIIQAVDDSVCELIVQEDGTYRYQYLCLDLFNSDYFEKLASAPVRQIIIPLQDIVKFLEQNLDDETAELLKKAKADFYYKTKS